MKQQDFFFFGGVDPSVGYQAVSWGLIVADAVTFKPLDELYIELKWDRKSQWTDDAQKVHGLSVEYLDKNGLTNEQVACAIGNLIHKHWPPTSDFSFQRNVRCLGHNVATFDIWFMRQLLDEFHIMFPTGSRFIDTSSIAFSTFGCFTSTEAFELLGLTRTKHNALEDARASLEFVRTVRVLCDSLLNGE